MKEFIDQIEQQGYCKIPKVLSEGEVNCALDLVIEWHSKTKDSVSYLPDLAKKDPFVWNLQNKDYYFLELLFSLDIVHHILTHFLNDVWFKSIPPGEPNYILRSFMARSSSELLPMHIDSLVPYQGSEVFVMQVALILEDQDETNGCTLVVPRSHKSGTYADQSAFKTAVPIASKAGDVVIWDSRIWHGTKENRTKGTRWSIIPTFTRWWVKQQFNIPQNLPQEFYDQLNDNQKAIRGYCSLPYNNEIEGVDIKSGYASLLEDVSGYRK